MKRNANAGRHPSYHFWRTYDRKEIDLVEESEGRLAAFEFRSGEAGRSKGITELWTESYPESAAEIVTPDTAHGFLDPPPVGGS